MRKYLALLLVLMMAFCSVGAYAEAPDVTGDWRMVYSAGGIDMLEMFVYLYENQTMDVMLADETIPGTWSFDGETLILHVDDDLILKWDAENHRFLGEQDGVTIIMSLPIEPEEEDAEPAEGLIVGGWSAAEDTAVTQEVQQLLWTALDSYQTGTITVSYTPVAYLGSQVVAGTNHAILCQAQEINAPRTWVIVYLYEALDGEATVLDIADLPLGV